MSKCPCKGELSFWLELLQCLWGWEITIWFISFTFVQPEVLKSFYFYFSYIIHSRFYYQRKYQCMVCLMGKGWKKAYLAHWTCRMWPTNFSPQPLEWAQYLHNRQSSEDTGKGWNNIIPVEKIRWCCTKKIVFLKVFAELEYYVLLVICLTFVSK